MNYEEFEAALLEAGVKEVTQAGGQCPFQVEGLIGKYQDHENACIYFRARGEAWSFEVYPTVRWCEDSEDPLYEACSDWGLRPFSAGYMTLEQALPIIKAQMLAVQAMAKLDPTQQQFTAVNKEKV